MTLWTLLAWPLQAAEPGLPGLSVTASSLELAQHVRDIFRQAAPRLAGLTGGQPSRIKVEVAQDREAFDRRVRQLGGPEWAAGLAMPGRDLIVLRSPKQLTQPQDFRPLLVHELTHLYLARQLRGRSAPLWLEEGLAMYAAGEGGFALAGTMAGGVLSERLKPLSLLESRFPAGAEEASLAYAQSYYLVSYLINAYGPETLPRLLRELALGRELTAALRKSTGRSLAQVEADFHEAMTSRFSWLALLFAGGTLWALVALGAGVALVWRRGRQKLRLRQLGELELQGKKDLGPKRIWPPPPRRGDVLEQAGLVKPASPESYPGDAGKDGG
ncbi:hypothetical protein AAU61_08080 [Desulfocarbo indianensis]|nr:hypothetical protein AAU61_08080 [Desulfocarbo indianensis]